MANPFVNASRPADEESASLLVGVGSEIATRTVEQVNEVIRHAKLVRSELKCVSQVLSFSSDVADRNVLLLELDPTLLDSLTRGESLVFRGDKADHAVLCTADKTYSVKEAETSNSLLLLEELTFPQSMSNDGELQVIPRKVVGVHHTYLEVTPCRPRVRRVRQLLQQNLFKGREYEDDNLSPKFTFADLMNRIQASEREVHSCLREIEAYDIDGCWRLLDFDYSCRLISHMLNLVEENSWSFTSVPKRQLLDTLEDLEPRSILEQCLDLYGYETEAIDDSGELLYVFDENKVCRFFANMILKSSGRFNFQEFCESWKQCVPDGMMTNIEQLEGIALIDRNARPEVIFYFPVSDLPEDVNERFNLLFETRPKWTFEEICPFIKCLMTDSLDLNGLLTKYARVSTVKGVRQYSSKKCFA